MAQEYKQYSLNDQKPKNWDFIKAHLQFHAILDIRRKGTLSSMTTKQSERVHGPLRKNYTRRTNFKNVMPQVHGLFHLWGFYK